MRLEAASDLRASRDVLRVLPHRLRALAHAKPGAEHGVDTIVEVEELVPGVQLLADVGEVHVRAAVEVPGPQVDVAERLEVDDLPRAEPLRLRRREAEEQLGAVGYELGPGNAGGQSHLLRQTGAAVEPAAREALADRRHVEQLQLLEDRLRSIRNVLEVIAAK